MARKAKASFDENTLTKGQLRKLNALRKSVGEEIAEKAFAEWLEKQPEAGDQSQDGTAGLIAENLWELVQRENIHIPRGGYLVRRGRGRVIVETPDTD